MIKSLTWFFLPVVLFGLFLLLAPALEGEQGYIVISFAGYLIEGSVIEFIITVLVTGLLGYLIVLLMRYAIKTIVLPSRWWRKRGDKVNANFFQNGLDLLALGQWQQAADQFLKVKRTEKIETAKQLAMFSAVQANDQTLTSDVQQKLNLPLLAAVNTENSETNQEPIKASDATFTQLILLVQQGAYQQAAAIIEKKAANLLKQSLPLQLLWLEIQLATKNWSAFDKHIGKMNKHVEKQQGNSALNEWQNKVENMLTGALLNLVSETSVNQLQQVWQSWHKATKLLPVVNSAYLTCLSNTKQTALVEAHLIEYGDKQGADWLLLHIRNYFCLIGQVHMDKLFTKVQKQVLKDRENKVLITILAYLAAGQKDFQLAKQALEQVIHSNQNQTDFKLYAVVLADLGEMHASVEVFKSLS